MSAAREVLEIPARVLDELERLNDTYEAGFGALTAMQNGLKCAEEALAQPPLPVVDVLLSDLTNSTAGLTRLGGPLRGAQFAQYEVAVALLKPSLTNLSLALDIGARTFDNLVRSTALPRLSLEARVQFEGLAGGLGYPYNEASSFASHSTQLNSDIPTAAELAGLADELEQHSTSSTSDARESLLLGLASVKNTLTGAKEASSQLRSAAAGFKAGTRFVSTVSLFALSGQVSTAVASLADTDELLALIDQADNAVQNFDPEAATEVLGQLTAVTEPGNRPVPGLFPRKRPVLMRRLALAQCATTANATAAYAAMSANIASIPTSVDAHIAAVQAAADSIIAVCSGNATVVAEVCSGTADIVRTPASCNGTATWNGDPQLPPCALAGGGCGVVGMVECDGSCVPAGTALPDCAAHFAAMPNSLAASCFSGCTYTPAETFTPSCDLDMATDNTDQCPVGCYNVASYQPSCDLDGSTDGIDSCPIGCTDPLYTVDAVQDAFAEAVVGVELRNPRQAEAELENLLVKLAELDFDALRVTAAEMGRRKAAVAAAMAWEADARSLAESLAAMESAMPVTYSVSTGVQCNAQGTAQVDTVLGCEAAATELGYGHMWDVSDSSHMSYRLRNCMYMPAEGKVFWNQNGNAEGFQNEEQAVCKGGLEVVLEVAISDLDAIILSMATFYEDVATWHGSNGGSDGFPQVPDELSRAAIEGIRLPLTFADDIASSVRAELLSSVLNVTKPDARAIVDTVRAGQIATEIPPDSTCTGFAHEVVHVCEGTASEVPAVCNGVFDLTGTRCALNTQASACELAEGNCPLAPADTPVCNINGWTSGVDTCPSGCCQRRVTEEHCEFTPGIPSSCDAACTYTPSNPGPEACVPTSDCRIAVGACTYVGSYTPICDFDRSTDASPDGTQNTDACPPGCDFTPAYTPDCEADFAAASDSYSDKCPGGCTYWSAPLMDAEPLPFSPDDRTDLRAAAAAVNDVSAFEALSSYWPALRASVADATAPVERALMALHELREGVVGMPPVLVPSVRCDEQLEDNVCSALSASPEHQLQFDEGTCHGTATTVPESCTGTADVIQGTPAACRGLAIWNDLSMLPSCADEGLPCGAVGMVECDGSCLPPGTALPLCDLSFAAAPVQSEGWCFAGCSFIPAVETRTPTCDLDNATDATAQCPAGCAYVPTATPQCDLDAGTDGSALCPAGCFGRAPGCVPHPPRDASAHAAAVDIAEYSLRLGIVNNFLPLFCVEDAISAGRLQLEAWEAVLADLHGDDFFAYASDSEQVSSAPGSVFECSTATCFAAVVSRWQNDWGGLMEALYSTPDLIDTAASEEDSIPDSAVVSGSGFSLQVAFLTLLLSVTLSALLGLVGMISKREPVRCAALLGLTLSGPLCLGQAALLTPVFLAGSDVCGGGPATLSSVFFDDIHLGYNDELMWATDQEFTDAVSRVYNVSEGESRSFTLPNRPPDPHSIFGLPLGAQPIVLDLVMDNGAISRGVELSSPAVLLHALLNDCKQPTVQDGYVVPPIVGVDEISTAMQQLARSSGAQAVESVREKLSAIGNMSPAMAAHLDYIERELAERLPDALAKVTGAVGCASLRSDLDAFGDTMCCEVLAALHAMVLWLTLLGCTSACGSVYLWCGSGVPELRQALPLTKEQQSMEEWRQALAGANVRKPKMPIAPGSPTIREEDDEDAWMYS
jgi:hypothetical protein